MHIPITRMKQRHDIMSRKKRSALMSRIHSRDTRVEKLMEQELAALGVDYVRSPSDVFGHPDFAIKGKKILIFCDGDFWHGYQIETNPRLDVKDNRTFWMTKINRNMDRDKLVNERLVSEGWTVLRFWEHDIKADAVRCARKIVDVIGENEA